MAWVCLVLVGSKKIPWMAWWSPGLLNHKWILISYISQLASQENNRNFKTHWLTRGTPSPLICEAILIEEFVDLLLLIDIDFIRGHPLLRHQRGFNLQPALEKVVFNPPFHPASEVGTSRTNQLEMPPLLIII